MDYKTTLESAYSRHEWQKMLHDIFGAKAFFFSQPHRIDHVDPDTAKQAYQLGQIALPDGAQLAIYEVELSERINIERNRRGLRDLLLSDWRSAGYAGAFMIFYRQGESQLRFTYASETYAFDAENHYQKQATAPRRYTYLLGQGRPCRTANERFIALSKSPQNLEDITRAFSVEALTRQFFGELFDWYQWALSPQAGVSFPQTGTSRAEDIEVKIIRMITRIIFVWFIKQKDLVPDCLFQPNSLRNFLRNFNPQSPTEGNYYNAILQNLFFAVLGHAIVDDEGHPRRFATASARDVKTLFRYAELFAIPQDEVIHLFASVPFLNGGLFECLDKTRLIDGQDVAFIDDGFSRNPTRRPDGHYRHRATVPNQLFFHPTRGLFPLLSRYNFTIEENTPDDQQVALDPELLGKVFENLLGTYNPETRTTARNESGSFYTPREVVNYMVDQSLMAYLGGGPTVEALFSPNFQYDPTQANAYPPIAQRLLSLRALDPACGSGAFPMGLLNRMVDILQRINPSQDTYQLKLHIIENCLYGSDIQSIAIQITKLRFFISLICNCQRNDALPNFGLPTLPNLETKFVAANSLIASKKKDAQGNMFVDPRIDTLKEELRQLRHHHFSARSTSTKRRIRQKDRELSQELAHLLDNSLYAPEDARQMAAWDPYDPNTSATFFDPDWMFGVAQGFDIVIGNPPYVQVKKGIYSREVYPYSEGKDQGKQNLYKLFVEAGRNLSSHKGVVCMIVQESLMCDVSARYTREMLLKKTKIKHFIHFPKNTNDPGLRVFKSALTGTCIVSFKNEEPEENFFLVSTQNNLSTISAPHFTSLSQESIIEGKCNLEIPLLKEEEGELYTKIKTQYRKLSDILLDSRQGNINTIHLAEIRSALPTSIRIGKGDKVHRFHLDVDNMMYARETRANFRLATDNEKGCAIVTQNISGTVDAWRIHACRAECKKTSIVFLHSTNIMYLSSPREAKIITGLLNSRLLDWIFRTTSTNNHVNLYELVVLPIPSAEAFASKAADDLMYQVERAERGEDVLDEIDRLVFDLYDLTPAEREVVAINKPID